MKILIFLSLALFSLSSWARPVPGFESLEFYQEIPNSFGSYDRIESYNSHSNTYSVYLGEFEYNKTFTKKQLEMRLQGETQKDIHFGGVIYLELNPLKAISHRYIKEQIENYVQEKINNECKQEIYGVGAVQNSDFETYMSDNKFKLFQTGACVAVLSITGPRVIVRGNFRAKATCVHRLSK